ncbi:MAG TPA: hypothetical protein DCY07_03325 [Rhodospirillaceae bacterium]|nr:hypothetical protein [Rhodospirillaceae bacterium]
MRKASLPVIVALAFVLTLPSNGANAQVYSLSSSSSLVSDNSVTYSRDRLAQLLAPIALYPDPLLAQVLIAATYPADIMDAASWLQSDDNASLRGYQLDEALSYQPWDPSVKELSYFPDVLRMMDENMGWTEQLGSAFISHQAAVMDEVQLLRQQAYAAGALRSTAQQRITIDNGAILIEPVSTDVVYVPTYNPSVVYGAWRYPAYPPYYFTPAYVYRNALIDFGVGVLLYRKIFHVHHVDYHRHKVHVRDRDYRYADRDHRSHNRSDVWRHEPSRRRDVSVHVTQRASVTSRPHEMRRRAITEIRPATQERTRSREGRFRERSDAPRTQAIIRTPSVEIKSTVSPVTEPANRLEGRQFRTEQRSRVMYDSSGSRDRQQRRDFDEKRAERQVQPSAVIPLPKRINAEPRMARQERRDESTAVTPQPERMSVRSQMVRAERRDEPVQTRQHRRSSDEVVNRVRREQPSAVTPETRQVRAEVQPRQRQEQVRRTTNDNNTDTNRRSGRRAQERQNRDNNRDNERDDEDRSDVRGRWRR